jgi:hypothetical protein
MTRVQALRESIGVPVSGGVGQTVHVRLPSRFANGDQGSHTEPSHD